MQCIDTQHNWVLEKTTKDTYWVYEVKRGRFSKQLRKPSMLGTDGSRYINFANIHSWYCTKCRNFDTTVDELGTWDQWLEKGYAVYDYKHDETIMPELSTKEASDK